MLRDIFDWLADHPTDNITVNTIVWLSVVAVVAVLLGGTIGKSR